MTIPLQDINTEWTDTGLAKGWSLSPQHNCQHSVSCSHAPSNVTVPHFPPALNHWWFNAEPTRGRASFSTIRYRSVTGKPCTRTSVKNRCVDDKNTPRCLQPSRKLSSNSHWEQREMNLPTSLWIWEKQIRDRCGTYLPPSLPPTILARSRYPEVDLTHDARALGEHRFEISALYDEF